MSLQEKAQKLAKKLGEVGDLIESLNEAGCWVNLEVWHNAGAESAELHQLNGELHVEVAKVDLIVVSR